MRSNLALVVLVAALTTLACKRQDTSPTAEPEPEPTTAAVEAEPEPEPAAGPDLQAMCEHALPIMRVALGLQDVEMTPEEQATTMSECVRGLEQEQATMPPEEFAAKAECNLKAATMDEMIACG